MNASPQPANLHHGALTDAYRLFFPLGVALGFAGVSIWPLFHWGVVDGYSVAAHAFIQTNCFVYAFMVGFLWTAVPRFTGTEAPGRPAQILMAALIVGEAIAFETYYFATAHLVFLIAHVGLCMSLVKRVMRRKHPPPETFALVGLGILSGLGAAVLNVGISFALIPNQFDLLGKRLLSEGMILLVVLGVGGFLGPRLLGFAQLPNLQNIERKPEPGPAAVNSRIRISVVLGAILLTSVVAEYVWSISSPSLATIAAAVRAAAATLFVLYNVQPWRLPAVRTTLSWSVWTAHWWLIAGLWFIVIFRNYTTAYLHVLFMGAFSLLILAVGTRVVLSHGGHPLSEERRSWPLRVAVATTLVAMSARVFAVYASTPHSYFGHLAWAAVLWMGGMLVWVFYVLRRLRQQ